MQNLRDLISTSEILRRLVLPVPLYVGGWRLDLCVVHRFCAPLDPAPNNSHLITRPAGGANLEMFSDITSETTEFRSSWRQTRSVREGGCQTERQETREATAQSTLCGEAGTQTENSAVRLRNSGVLSGQYE